MKRNKADLITVCSLPATGLGNQLFPLMKALVFAHLNNADVLITGYHHVRLGPYLRFEKSKRKYNRYFTFQRNFLVAWFEHRKAISLLKCPHIDEPLLEKRNNAGIYVYSKIPHWSDYFFQLKDYRSLVIRLFWKTLNENIRSEVLSMEGPVIGVHIHMGDFKKLQPGQDFSKVGATRTPEQYFVHVIQGIREIHGSAIPVSIFTDAYRKEFKELLKMENVTMVEGNKDIVDLLLLSKSKIIVTSAASTFSYWSAFLSEATVIMHFHTQTYRLSFGLFRIVRLVVQRTIKFQIIGRQGLITF